MPYAPADRLGPYEIVGPIGAGGMGDVYKARDTRLERSVAIKVSKEAFTERFRNEALAIAALNHPHICTLHDVGPDYLVMEYVEGRSAHGPLPVPEAMRLAGQIADALEHAHQKGVVHRDLKPSNILLTKSGVKVLDFGLAKRLSQSGSADETGPTLTEAGTLVGTPRYMAPEQIDGKPADERTDIFAFGLVLYEMLTGQRAFEGKSAPSVMAAILAKDPTPILALKPETPPALAQVVETCLAKDPAERWQSVRELKHALAWAARPASSSVIGRRGWIRAAAAAAVVLVIVSGAALALRRSAKPPRPQPVRLPVTLPPTAELFGPANVAVSPDGQRLALVLSLPDKPPQLFVRPLDALAPTAVVGGEIGFGPFWSPDSQHIALWGPTGLRSVDLGGGAARSICKECRKSGGMEYGATWGTADVIVYSDLGKLYRVPAEGGEPEPLAALVPGETGRFWPQFLPDGRHYLYLSLASRREDQAIYVGALDSDLRQRVVAAEYGAAYSPPGYLLYIKDGALVAQPFDARRLTLSGTPTPILDEEVSRFPGTVLAGRAHFSVSTNGVLAWRPGPTTEHRQLTWFDRSGRKLGTLGEPGAYVAHALSPDEKSVAACRVESASDREIWILDVASGTPRRLTFDPHDDCNPVWSPDGSRIAFFSDRRGVREIYQKRADGSGDDELLVASEDFGLNLESWSADGRFLSYNSARPGRSNDIFLVPLSKPGEASPVPFLATQAVEHFSALSPNGRFLAYHSDESGPGGAVRSRGHAAGPARSGEMADLGRSRFALPAVATRRPGAVVLRRGRAGGRRRPDGRLHFPSRGPEAARRPAGRARSEGFGLWSVSRDGQRLLFGVPTRPPEPIRILVNWLPPGV